MLFGAAEALLLAGLVALAYFVLAPLRRWLEGLIARRLRGGRRPRGPGRVVVLERRRDGSYGKEDRHG